MLQDLYPTHPSILSRLVRFIHTSQLSFANHSRPSGLQKATATPGVSALSRIMIITKDMWRQEGVRSFYKGLTPRILRVAPGQSVVFAVYERISGIIERMNPSTEAGRGFSE